jgi:hypothetical protein
MGLQSLNYSTPDRDATASTSEVYLTVNIVKAYGSSTDVANGNLELRKVLLRDGSLNVRYILYYRCRCRSSFLEGR